jgi:hypothetical protein
MGGGESENEGGDNGMAIMTCIIGQTPVYHKPLFDNSVVAPDDGGPRAVGYSQNKHKHFWGSVVKGIPTKYTPEKDEPRPYRRRKSKIPAEKIEEIFALRAQGWGVNRIAKEIGVSIDTAYRYSKVWDEKREANPYV